MNKNVKKNEQIVRIILGIIFGVIACFITGLTGWVRIISGVIAVAFLGTALVGY